MPARCTASRASTGQIRSTTKTWCSSRSWSPDDPGIAWTPQGPQPHTPLWRIVIWPGPNQPSYRIWSLFPSCLMTSRHFTKVASNILPLTNLSHPCLPACYHDSTLPSNSFVQYLLFIQLTCQTGYESRVEIEFILGWHLSWEYLGPEQVIMSIWTIYGLYHKNAIMW